MAPFVIKNHRDESSTIRITNVEVGGPDTLVMAPRSSAYPTDNLSTLAIEWDTHGELSSGTFQLPKGFALHILENDVKITHLNEVPKGMTDITLPSTLYKKTSPEPYQAYRA